MVSDPERVHKLGKMIIDHFGHKRFHGAKILDLGSGDGNFALMFSRLGAVITCVDARKNNIDAINKKHPFLKTMVVDLENEFPFDGQTFDFCFSLGLLNHLKSFDKHIQNICNVAENIVLECEILDSDDANLRVPIYEERTINHLSFSGEGSIVSVPNIHRRISDMCATYKRCDETKLNHGQHRYDWKEQGIGRKYGNRRLFFIRRDPFFAKKGNLSPHATINNLNAIVGGNEPQIAPKPPNMPAPPVQQRPGSIHISNAGHRVSKSNQPKYVNTNDYFIHSVRKSDSITNSTIRLFYLCRDIQNIEDKKIIDFCISKLSENKLLTIVNIEINEEITFDRLFDKINSISGPDDINIVADSDVFFDSTILLAQNIKHKEVYALTCWDTANSNNIIFRDRKDSQSAWITRGPINKINGSFPLGAPSSDSRMAYEFHKAGYRVFNPSKSIKAYSNNIDLNKGSKSPVHGPHLFIVPTEIT